MYGVDGFASGVLTYLRLISWCHRDDILIEDSVPYPLPGNYLQLPFLLKLNKSIDCLLLLLDFIAKRLKERWRHRNYIVPGHLSTFSPANRSYWRPPAKKALRTSHQRRSSAPGAPVESLTLMLSRTYLVISRNIVFKLLLIIFIAIQSRVEVKFFFHQNSEKELVHLGQFTPPYNTSSLNKARPIHYRNMANKPIFVATHPRSCSTAFERVRFSSVSHVNKVAYCR